MPTAEDLGRLVKAKYPGKYDALSDLEVGKRVRQKYPAYRTQFSDVYTGKPNLPLEEDVAAELGLGAAFAGPAARLLSAPASMVGRGAVAGGRALSPVARKAAPVARKAVEQTVKRALPAGLPIGLWELWKALQGGSHAR